MFDDAKMREILTDELGCDLQDVDNDTLLFSTGVVDSFTLVSLIMAVEREAGIRINPGDVTLENVDSINRIVTFVNKAIAA